MYSTAVSRKKKYTKSPCVMELTKFGAERKDMCNTEMGSTLVASVHVEIN
jgi:hypothetical protein